MAYNRRKRKVRKNIPEAQAHISSSYNNTLVTITDKEGNTISWASSGTIGYKGSKKKTPYAAGLAAEQQLFVHYKQLDLKSHLSLMKLQYHTMDVDHQKDLEIN